MTERDPFFKDVGRAKKRIFFDSSKEAESFVVPVPIRESRGIIPGKHRAILTFHFQMRAVSEHASSMYGNKSIAWWKEWKSIKKYAESTVAKKEDYNRYDSIIRDVVAEWNKLFCDDSFPPDEPLDPNLVKAILYQESRVGNDPKAGINIMQVGNTGDPSMKTLRGELKEYWMYQGKEQQLKYDAKVMNIRGSIKWGVRWLYHKAQGIRGHKRYWRTWLEAVRGYGPPRSEYSESIWSIYTKGSKESGTRVLQLWAVGILAIVASALFVVQTTQESLAQSVMNSLSQEDRFAVDDIEVQYSGDHSLFWSILSREKDWWEDIRIGKKEGARIRWFSIDHPPTEQSILKARFLTLKGFDAPIFEVYGQTHVGNGALYLYEIFDEHARLLLEVPGVVDSYNGFPTRIENFKRYGYYGCGELYREGALESNYRDINNDGVDDLIMHGTQDVICEQVSGDEARGEMELHPLLVESSPQAFFFIWDPSTKEYRTGKNRVRSSFLSDLL